MAHFLMITDAPEGVKPHPLDTQLVMLPEGVNPYRLLAAACRFTAEGGVLDVPGGDDEVAYAILRTRFTQMAATKAHAYCKHATRSVSTTRTPLPSHRPTAGGRARPGTAGP